MTAAIMEYSSASTWDAVVASHPHGHLLQGWAWGAFKSEFGWQPIRVAVVDPSGARAGAQLLVRRFAGLSVCYVPRGPMFSGDDQIDRLLIQCLQRIARRYRAAFLRFEPNLLESDPAANRLHSLLQVTGGRVAEPLQPRSSIHVDLSPEPERLFAAFSKGHRADVRRAERNGVAVRVGNSAADLESFYAIMRATSARAQFAIHSQEYYRRAWELGGETARLLLARQAGADVAAFLVFGAFAEGQYMYSGATAEGLKSSASHLLQWHAIRWVRERGGKRYDLWGVPEVVSRLAAAGEAERPSLEAELQADPLHGVYRFKKGWGGSVVRYLPAYDRVYLAPAYWLWKRRGGNS